MLQEKLLQMLPIDMIDTYLNEVKKDPKKALMAMSKVSPESMEVVGKKKALKVFHHAAAHVSQYKKFLLGKKVDPADVKTYEDFISLVPEKTKESYVKAAERFHDILTHPSVLKPNIIFQSSGYTGKPTLWAKSRAEEEHDRMRMAIGLELLFNIRGKKTLFINGFALGSWATGVELSRISDHGCTIINPGANDDDILSIIKTFKGDFQKIIISAYPPFVKNILERGKAEGIDFSKIDINFILGGEGMPEGLRDRIYSLIGKEIDIQNKKGNVYSGFGSSDIGIIGPYETFESVQIKRLSMKHPVIAERLFGKRDMAPMLFQFDPTKHFIYANKDQELVFTNLDCGVLPLIKYNLKDKGGIIPYREMQQILKDFYLDLDIPTPFPFLFVEGRSDGAVSFFGSNIFPTKIQEILLEDDKIEKAITGNFHIGVKYNARHDPMLNVELQLKGKIKPSASLQNRIAGYLSETMLVKVLDLKPKRHYIAKHYKNGFVSVKLYLFNAYPYKAIKFKYH
ncbi:phenylacetate--CoA ligase family protein [Candidatus Woesearchaeota archaeon]|nr:phenylacetate--CoA ligase family protein [Candidatus Woesearchaeota archaeon]